MMYHDVRKIQVLTDTVFSGSPRHQSAVVMRVLYVGLNDFFKLILKVSWVLG